MSKTLLDSVAQIFRPQRPLWACEFTPRHVIVAGVDSSRHRISAKQISALSPDAISGSLNERNVTQPEAVSAKVKDLLGQTGFKGSEISVVIPDDSTRIAFLTVDTLPGSEAERETFVRWKLKKTVPFEVDDAQVAFKVLGEHRGVEGKGIDILVALSPRTIVEEYERLMEALDLHCGSVVPSSLAALNLLRPPKEDVLFIKVAPGCISTTVFQDKLPRFYRRVSEMSLYDAAYPTILYHQDKLGGNALSSVIVCGYDAAMTAELSELQDKLNVPIQKLEPKNMDDIYKPALGAIGLVWSNLI